MRHPIHEQHMAQGEVHSCWPTSVSMEQLLLRTLQDALNCMLYNPLLKVGVDSKEGESLTTIFA